MSDSISDFERRVLLKVLEGSHQYFETLRKQIDGLNVEGRIREQDRYFTEFYSSKANELKHGSHSNNWGRTTFFCLKAKA